MEGVDDFGVFGFWEGVYFFGEGFGEDYLKLVVDLVGYGVLNLVFKFVGIFVDVVVFFILFNLVFFVIDKEVVVVDLVSYLVN